MKIAGNLLRTGKDLWPVHLTGWVLPVHQLPVGKLNCKAGREAQWSLPYPLWEEATDFLLCDMSTVLVARMSHRKWRETRQQLIWWPDLALLGCCLVSLHFQCDILATITVKGMNRVLFPPPRNKILQLKERKARYRNEQLRILATVSGERLAICTLVELTFYGGIVSARVCLCVSVSIRRAWPVTF